MTRNRSRGDPRTLGHAGGPVTTPCGALDCTSGLSPNDSERDEGLESRHEVQRWPWSRSAWRRDEGCQPSPGHGGHDNKGQCGPCALASFPRQLVRCQRMLPLLSFLLTGIM